MSDITNSIDELKIIIKNMDALIELLEDTTATSVIFLNQKTVSNILSMSRGQVARLFLREDFPSCNYVKAHIVEYNAFLGFLEAHINEDERFREAYNNLRKVDKIWIITM